VTVRLASLLGEVDVVEAVGDIDTVVVTAVTQDSVAVVPGALYCCVPGFRTDGHELAGAVVAAGAGALLVERRLDVAVPQVVVPSARRAVAAVAAAFHGHPDRSLAVVGVTGTNGKTTTAHLLAAICNAGGRPAAVIGTLTGARTTPEAPVLQAMLAAERDEGRDVVAMEVSSMALDQHRADAISFAVGVFTNFSQDHLDYHGSMERYFEAKAQLFEPGRVGAAVINVDDAWGRRLLEELRVPAVTFGLGDAVDLDVGLTDSSFTWRGLPVHLALGGIHNVANGLAAAAAASVLEIEPADVAAGLATVGGVPGRFEAIEAGQPFVVLVDYAHTPDGLEQALRSLGWTHGGSDGLTVVFGCGGDRDRTKRPLMTAVATRLADRVVLTSDNPRSEDPAAIIAEAAAGAERPEVLIIEPDRAAAIALAVAGAGPGDIVLIAGKGHETGQIVGDRVVPFDDRAAARSALAALGFAKVAP
jgi:UDP-N-acetylmuramoyl-L-alanyl-D-glutamate--2,6-diaminopimelate ligase